MAITGACFPFSDKPKWILLVLSPWDPQCCLHPIAHNSTHRPATLHWLWPTSRSARQPNNHLNWYTNLSKPKKSDQLTQKQIYSYIVNNFRNNTFISTWPVWPPLGQFSDAEDCILCFKVAPAAPTFCFFGSTSFATWKRCLRTWNPGWWGTLDHNSLLHKNWW